MKNIGNDTSRINNKDITQDDYENDVEEEYEDDDRHNKRDTPIENKRQLEMDHSTLKLLRFLRVEAMAIPEKQIKQDEENGDIQSPRTPSFSTSNISLLKKVPKIGLIVKDYTFETSSYSPAVGDSPIIPMTANGSSLSLMQPSSSSPLSNGDGGSTGEEVLSENLNMEDYRTCFLAGSLTERMWGGGKGPFQMFVDKLVVACKKYSN